MSINKVHCLFEQLGTFKKEFEKLGIQAEDYDILNEFGQTDHIVDLFHEIRQGYDGEPSIFDEINENDFVFAFFPCVRFSAQILLYFKGVNFSQSKWSMERKLEYDLHLHQELNEMYELITKLALIALRKNIKMVIENPYSTQHYLYRYWALDPALIDNDRTKNGDYFKKPTQFFFLNCKPKQNVIDDPISCKERFRIVNIKSNTIGNTSEKIARSLISPEYAKRFIKQYIL